jgi:peptidoglycan glycosyltransferase
VQKRIFTLAVFFLIAFSLLFLQLNNLQVLQAQKLSNANGNNNQITKEFSLPRGAILTADGKVIADTVSAKNVYHYQREYPYGSLYGDVTGFDSIIYGRSGLEASYNSYLQGSLAPPNSISSLFSTKYQTDSVVTTINSTLQETAAKALGSLYGAVVAIDPKTGSILALYSAPSFDPNPLSSPSGSVETAAWKLYNLGTYPPLLDLATSRSFPPGSTFKIVTSSAVYDHDPAIATQSFPVESVTKLPQTTLTLHNYAYEACGGTLPVLLQVSCDTGFANIGLELGASNLAQEAAAFGFNAVPPLDVPGAAASYFPPASFFSQNLPQLAYSAIGQGNDSATPLQMALVASAIANHGVIETPHLMSEIVNYQNQVIRRYQPHPWKIATSAQTAAKVTSLMEGVVNGGTAQGIALPGVKIAAKTGTAQTNLSSGSTATGRDDNWMVAFAPAQNPQIAVAVVVPQQPGLSPNPTGAQYAGPVVKAMLAAALGVG